MMRLILIFAAVVTFSGCNPQNELKDFSSDGCSLFPDRDLIFKKDWCECCFTHDIAYWKGGTRDERLLADTALRDCVYQKTGNKLLADSVYHGVRLGGSPYFYNWYRWGYGWSYKRKYKPLTHDEEMTAQKKLEKYFSENKTPVCQ
jgi:hypothetical protein